MEPAEQNGDDAAAVAATWFPTVDDDGITRLGSEEDNTAGAAL